MKLNFQPPQWWRVRSKKNQLKTGPKENSTSQLELTC
jgi:hypothetical protein